MGLFTLLKAVPGAFFWSSVIAFIPVSLYLVMKGVAREKDRNDVNLKIVYSIFGICFLFYYVVYIVGYLQGRPSGADSFAIFSSISIVSFWLAVIVYMPVAIFQGSRHALLRHKAKIIIKVSYLTFTVCLLIVSVLYGIHWMGSKTGFGLIDLATAIPIVLLSSALLSIIPILIFVILKSTKPDSDHERKKQRIVIMCLTYGGFLLIFSMLYVYNWAKNIAVEARLFDVMLLSLNLLYIAGIVSFLPRQIYVMIKISFSRNKPQLKVLFIIYCVSFVLLTTIYSFQWLEKKRQGFLGAEQYGDSLDRF